MATDKPHPHEASLADRAPQRQRKHADEWQRDLNPQPGGGQNIGQRHADDVPGVRSAADIKELTRRLQDFTPTELRQIPVLPEGAQLEQGATYVDLNDDGRAPFTATGDMFAAREMHLVPKREVAHTVWNRLIGRTDPERTQ